jgi:palmitoyltransferase
MVAITVGILTFRCFYNILFGGMTQIEGWEHERIESQLESGRLYPIIKRNYKLIFGKELKSLISWSTSHNILRDTMDEPDALNIGIDDFVFPYDVNPWANLINAFGYPWNWLLPWGGPRGDGITFQKNELLDSHDEDLSSLPWPPDGNHQDRVEEVIGQPDEFSDENERIVRRRVVSPETDIGRAEWRNDFGEKLSDFGVDIDAEE